VFVFVENKLTVTGITRYVDSLWCEIYAHQNGHTLLALICALTSDIDFNQNALGALDDACGSSEAKKGLLQMPVSKNKYSSKKMGTPDVF